MFVAGFWEGIRITIPALMEHLTDSNYGVRTAAIKLLSRLAALGMCYSITFRWVRWWVCSSMFVAKFREDVPITIFAIMECLKDSYPDVRKAAIEGISSLAAQGMH